MVNNALGAKRRPVVIVSVLLVLVVVLRMWGLRSPPQMGADEEAFKTVDALFTAITSRDHHRLDDCERRLHAHRAAGRLPPAAAAYLDGVIQQSRSGDWERSGKKLYDFMYRQRRE